MKRYEKKAKKHDELKAAEAKKGRKIESSYHGAASKEIREKKRNLKHKEKRHLFKSVRKAIKKALVKKEQPKEEAPKVAKPKKGAPKKTPKPATRKPPIKPIKLNREPTYSEQIGGNPDIPLSEYGKGIRDSNRRIFKEREKTKSVGWDGRPHWSGLVSVANYVALAEQNNGNPYWKDEDGKIHKNKSYAQGRKDAISSIITDKKILVPMEHVKPPKHYPSPKEISLERERNYFAKAAEYYETHGE